MKAKYFLVAILSVAGVVGCGILGWIIGATIGGNISSDFIYRGLPGYEGTGMLGFHIGLALGIVSASFALWRKYQNKTRI